MVSVAVPNIDFSWQAPTENIDGSTVNALQGFGIYSVENGIYILERVIDDPGATRFSLAKAPGTYDFVMTAYDTAGDESAYSNSVRKIAP